MLFSSNSNLPLTLILAAALLSCSVSAAPLTSRTCHKPSNESSCFPSLGFSTPKDVPQMNSTESWWCDPNTEYGFLGFSYEVTSCQSADDLDKDFKDIRQNFNGRYVRLYGACDEKGFYDRVVDAAWNNALGIHALIWFGFDGDDKWISRRDALFNTLQTNPKAPFVTRVVQFGSEPLFDNVLPTADLASEVSKAKKTLAPLGIPVTVSELAFGYQSHPGSDAVLKAVDSINAHILPFFSQKATTGAAAWPLVQADLSYFKKNGGGKKIYFDQTGWPDQVSSGVQPNSAKAVSNVHNEQAYFDMLDAHCEDLKADGVGWFAHLYAEAQGYGIYDSNGKLKFPFKPKTHC